MIWRLHNNITLIEFACDRKKAWESIVHQWVEATNFFMRLWAILKSDGSTSPRQHWLEAGVTGRESARALYTQKPKPQISKWGPELSLNLSEMPKEAGATNFLAQFCVRATQWSDGSTTTQNWLKSRALYTNEPKPQISLCGSEPF